MPAPRSWESLLHGPSYLINLDSRPDRLVASLGELRRAGFDDVRRFVAIDARDPVTLEQAWAAHGSPKFAEWDGGIDHVLGKQGCFLSHLAVWQEIIVRNLAYACVFEDDVVFSQFWAEIAPTAFAFTPQEYDLLYMGSLCLEPGSGLVRRVPVYGMHAYVITREGALKLRSELPTDPDGIGSIDIMLWRQQDLALSQSAPRPLSWYVWDGSTFHGHRDRPHLARRQSDMGLVFQDWRLGTDIDA